MRVTVAAALCAAAVVGPAPALAHDGHDHRPRITAMHWEDPPVTAAEEGCEESCHEEILVVKARAPRSSIEEVQVHFGEGAPIVFAHTYCVQGKEPGTPAKLRIPVSYREEGTYMVRAVAISHKGCKPHEKGDGHPRRRSAPVYLETEVLAP